MSTDAIQFAGEFAIEELKIVTPTEQVADLISDVLVIEINIFEDIFSNVFFYFIFVNFFTDLIKEEIFFKDVVSFNYFIAIATSIFILGFIIIEISISY